MRQGKFAKRLGLTQDQAKKMKELQKAKREERAPARSEETAAYQLVRDEAADKRSPGCPGAGPGRPSSGESEYRTKLEADFQPAGQDAARRRQARPRQGRGRAPRKKSVEQGDAGTVVPQAAKNSYPRRAAWKS